jgi:hypothetical protein
MSWTNVYTVAEVVEIVVKVGTKAEREAERSKRPGSAMIMPSNEFISELSKFLAVSKILPCRSISSGGGQYHALFEKRDARRIVEWLSKHGARQSSTVL